jgi:hypothetical protein
MFSRLLLDQEHCVLVHLVVVRVLAAKLWLIRLVEFVLDVVVELHE